MAICTTFVIMTGGVDLSVGPVLAAAGLVSYYSLEAGLPLVLVGLAGLSIGVLVGLANGAAIAFLELPPIIVTLAMLSIARGCALILGGPAQHLIRNRPGYTFIGAGNLFGLPFPIYVFALAAIVLIVVQRRTPLGLLVAAIGDNERAAYLSGHRTRATKTLVYVISGFGAALAGIIRRPKCIRRLRHTGRSARSSTSSPRSCWAEPASWVGTARSRVLCSACSFSAS